MFEWLKTNKMIAINTTSEREECSTNGQLTSIAESQSKLIVSNAEEVRDDQPDLLIIECTNPYCQICHGIGDKEDGS